MRLISTLTFTNNVQLYLKIDTCIYLKTKKLVVYEKEN